MYIWAVIVWCVFAGFYLGLAGDLSTVEIIAGVVCATAGTALAVSLSLIETRRFAGVPPLRAVWRPVAAMFPETWAVGRTLVAATFSHRGRYGAFVRQPFEPGANDDAVTAGRRAAVVIGLSLAPRSFVIRGEDTQTMILHALPPRAPRPDKSWPA